MSLYPPPRPRPPPPPLRLESSNSTPFAPRPTRASPYALSNTSKSVHSPSAMSIYSTQGPYSPPRSPPHSGVPLISPNRMAHSPPPFVKPPQRASPPPLTEDIEEFERNCRDFFYRQSEASGRKISSTLSNLPPSQRARFTRIQASIRTQFHADRILALQSSLLALLSATTPSHSLTPASRSKPHSKAARKEREEKMQAFLTNWGGEGLIGASKFCEALYCVLRVMALPESVGGAGGRRVEWELDDAVFMESAGEEFMHDSVIILKGVLGFSDTLPLSASIASLSSDQSPLPPPPNMGRSRSSSDPFTDPSTPSLSSSPNASLRPSAHDDRSLATELCAARLWLSPSDLSNPTISRLATLFPAHITRSTRVPRFNAPAERKPDVESLAAGGEEWVQLSTGRMRLTAKERGEGWKGGMWDRMREWIRRVVGV